LQNVQKYAGATLATIRIEEVDSMLRFEVEDDGAGFDVATVRKGSGLSNMADSLDALGGHLEIHSRLGHRCRLVQSVPAGAPVPA
jgi:signal transduction histidine kinase